MAKISLILGASVIALFAGVRLHLNPITRPVARTAWLARDKAQSDLKAANPDATEDEISDAGYDAYLKSMAQSLITDWDGGLDENGQVIPGGVGDADGNPLPVTPDNVAMLISLDAPGEVFYNQVVAPYMAERAEKNGSSTSSTGSTVEGAEVIAPGAQNQPEGDLAG